MFFTASAKDNVFAVRIVKGDKAGVHNLVIEVDEHLVMFLITSERLKQLAKSIDKYEFLNNDAEGLA